MASNCVRVRHFIDLMFSPTIAHVTIMAATLQRCDLKTEPIYGEKQAPERYMLIRRFKVGQLDILSSVDLFSEGVAVADVDLTFLCACHTVDDF